MAPREMRRAWMTAFGNARLDGRATLSLDDLPEGRRAARADRLHQLTAPARTRACRSMPRPRVRVAHLHRPGAAMSTAANVVVALVALLHVYILVLEMFLWDKPAGLRAFGQTREAAAATKVLAANQGCTTASSPPDCSGV